MKTYRLRGVLATALLSTLFAPVSDGLAQSMKPGLWEQVASMKSQSGEMERAMAEAQKQMASMPPEQRRQMEQAMGMQMGSAQGGRQTVRMCVTAEDAAKFNVNDDPNCRQQVLQRGGDTVRIKFTCGGEMPSEGEGTITFKGDTAFNAKMQVQTRAGGRTDRMEIVQDGKWLGSDCGTLKPGRKGGPASTMRN